MDTTPQQVSSNQVANQLVSSGLALPVMEHFYTIQGEGANSGKAAYFVRLGGCDVGCVWCDVKESWSFTAHPVVKIQQILLWVKNSGATHVVITGGEPSLYNLAPLTQLLHEHNLSVWIETSGTNLLTGNWDWICFSPKKFKEPNPLYFDICHELKVIIANKHDLIWAQQLAQKTNKKSMLLLQPEWEKQDKMLPQIIEFVKANPQWKISLQTHKYMQIP